MIAVIIAGIAVIIAGIVATIYLLWIALHGRDDVSRLPTTKRAIRRAQRRQLANLRAALRRR